ncbi:MAG: DNA mismatch repair protein MutS [Deltaproteobacteria bacterium]|nr:DNA mismatch repair protein MutS [Deltaproteobacteria bacterium]
MIDPKQTYQQRLEARTRELDTIRARYDLIAWSRLGTLLASAAISLASWRWSLGLRGAAAAAVAFVAFLVLVFVHARLARTRAQVEAAISWHRRALDRLAGKWTAFAERGDRFVDDNHPYALDLDVYGPNSLFQYLNDTRTPFGERTLAAWLGDGSKRDDVAARQEAALELSQLPDLREELFVAGCREADHLSDPDPLLAWCEQGPRLKPSAGLKLLCWLSPALLISVLVATSYAPLPGWTPLIIFVANLLLLQSLRKRLQPAIEATTKRSSELDRYGSILAVIERHSFQSTALRLIASRLRASGAPASVEIRRLARLVAWLEARQNGAFRTIVGPSLLWDFHWVDAIEKWQRRVGTNARGWLEVLGTFEALASIATFAFEHPAYAVPEIDESELVFEAQGLGHPLLDEEKRVLNDVTLPGAGAAMLVTGSNMSGKSTLLRSIGVAAVLAMAGAPVCARKMRIGTCVVRTSMRVSDSLRDGISRFYAELLKLKGVVETARGDQPVLFLLDEILHGTNSRERHIGARSIIRALIARDATGAVSTHDLALAELEQSMAGKVRNVHFEEQVVDGKMTFDYLLRDGVVRSGNALRWMRIVGLEVDED